MINIKNYIQFNESIRDLMAGKSDEEILKSLDDLTPDNILKKSCKIGYLNGVKIALERGADPSNDHNYSIEWASHNGHAEIVKLLLQDPRVNPSADDNYTIRIASEIGFVEIVKLLLKDKRVDPSTCDNFAIRIASNNGHTEIVKLLIQDPRVDPSADYNISIRYASQNGHIDIVKLLLSDPRVDPSDYNNYAIRWASSNDYIDIVKLLLQNERVREKLTKEEIEKYENQINGLNESIRDLMKGKSNDEILDKILKNENPITKLKLIEKFKLYDDISKDILNNIVDELSDKDLIKYFIIKSYNIDYYKDKLINIYNNMSIEEKKSLIWEIIKIYQFHISYNGNIIRMHNFEELTLNDYNKIFKRYILHEK